MQARTILQQDKLMNRANRASFAEMGKNFRQSNRRFCRVIRVSTELLNKKIYKKSRDSKKVTTVFSKNENAKMDYHYNYNRKG